MRIQISGSSDDIIMVEGDLSDELYPSDDKEGSIVAVSDGTVLRVIYGPSGIWRITPISLGTATYHKDENPEDDDDRYSDVITLEGDIKWVVMGKAIVR